MSQAVNLDHAMFWAPPTRIATKRASRMLVQPERSQSNSSVLQADEFQANPFSAPGQAPDDAISIYSDTESILNEGWDSDADRERDDNPRLYGSLEDDTLPSLGAIIASLAETRPDLDTSSDMPSQIRTGTAGSYATVVAQHTADTGVLAGEGDAGLLERLRRDSSQGQQDGTNACPAAPSSPTERCSLCFSYEKTQSPNAEPDAWRCVYSRRRRPTHQAERTGTDAVVVTNLPAFQYCFPRPAVSSPLLHQVEGSLLKGWLRSSKPG